MPAQQILSIHQSLAPAKHLAPKTRTSIDATLHRLRSRLFEDPLACRVFPSGDSATVPHIATRIDRQKPIYRYQLKIRLPDGNARVLLDTTGSGVVITRALASKNHLHPAAGAPQNTVHVDRLHVGRLELEDCTVGGHRPTPSGSSKGQRGRRSVSSLAHHT